MARRQPRGRASAPATAEAREFALDDAFDGESATLEEANDETAAEAHDGSHTDADVDFADTAFDDEAFANTAFEDTTDRERFTWLRNHLRESADDETGSEIIGEGLQDGLDDDFSDEIDDSAYALTEYDAVDQEARAEAIATIAHRGQLDKLGARYIDHPARVAESFDKLLEHCAAWLHDVLEDTSVTADDLLDAGIMPEIVDVVILLTRSPDVSYAEYYSRIRENPAALAVKLADIEDNCAPWRVRHLDAATQARLEKKYHQARRALGVEALDVVETSQP
jgi:hypothetical protein